MNGEQLGIDFSARRLARASDPFTSQEAAARVREFASGHCALILQALIDYGPETAEGLQVWTDIPAYAVRKRLPELERAGLAKPTGDVAPTVSGRSQRIWAAL